MITIIVLFILGGLSAWEEVQQLIERQSWCKENYRIPYWTTDWKTWEKNLDSHHVSYGLFILFFLFSASIIKIEILLIPLYWGLLFYFRNIWMHIIFKKEPLYKYLYTFWK